MSTASGGSIFSRTYGLKFFFDFTTCHWASAGAGRTIGPWMVEVLGVQIVPASCVGLVLRWWDIDIYIYIPMENFSLRAQAGTPTKETVIKHENLDIRGRFGF